MTSVLKVLNYIESQRGNKIVNIYHFVLYVYAVYFAGPSGRAVYGVGLRPLACWVRGFESHGGDLEYLSVVSVVCCQVEVSATSWSLVQRSPTDCDA